MSPEASEALARGRNSLDAARHLAAGGFAAAGVSRVYYAAFYAAEAALLVLGEARSRHAGVMVAFERLVVREGEVPAGTGRLLRSLFRRRNEADDGVAEVPLEQAEAAIRDAERFVDAVASWIGTRSA